jgi:general secretion pathway protein M
MSELPRGTMGRVLAVAIGLVLLAVIDLAVVTPLLDFYDGREQQLHERMELIDRLERAARDLPRLRATAEQWGDGSQPGPLLASDSTDAVVAAGLQSTVKNLVATAGASLNSAEILPPLSQEAYRRVGIHVSFSGDTDLLVTVLRGIETASPQLFVDNLEIRSAAASTGRDVGGGLVIALDVYGFRSS